MPSTSAAAPTGAGGCSSDRAQAPSGAGYAIENRLALSRAIPDIYRTTRVERVAPFFQAFQAELLALSRQDDRANLPAHAGADERDLFRARLSGALSRTVAGRGRRSDRARRWRLRPHRLRVAAHRSLAAPDRCRFCRPARTQCCFSPRRSGTVAGRPRRQDRHHQFARRRIGRGARDAGVPAGAGAERARRRSRDTECRDLVARPRRHARRDDRKTRPHGDRASLRTADRRQQSPTKCLGAKLDDAQRASADHVRSAIAASTMWRRKP